MERPSQADAPEVQAAASLPDREVIRKREIERALGMLVRRRPYVLPVVAGLIGLGVLWAPTPERLRAWVVLAGPVLLLTAFDRWRTARAGYTLSHVPYDLALVFLLQGNLIGLTGLIDSPLAPLLVLMTLVGGLALRASRSRVVLVVGVSAVIWALFALQLDGRWPQVAALLPPPPLDPERVLWRAVVLQGMLVPAVVVGEVAHGAIMHGIDATIDARQGLLESLATRNAELTSLSGALAHELKNPLASIHGLVTLMERNDDNRARRFAVLRREIDRMKRTVDELLDFARPTEAPAPLVPARLFAAVAAEREAAAEARGVRVDALASDEAHWVVADERKLRRALANLLDNAIEASPSGAHVSWVARAVGERLEIGVADRGPGLPSGAGTLGFTTKPEGSGFGLAVSRTIAEQHGGSLALRAREGGGAEVVLVLPRAQEVPT